MNDDIDLLSSSSSFENPSFSSRTPRIFDRFDSSSSSENDEFSTPCSSSTSKKLDYMIQFLDRKLSAAATTTANSPLPEFTAGGGGNLPLRAAVRPDRPVSVEVRPRPLRETQVGRGLRTVYCAAERRELWAGGESSIRVWNLGGIEKGGGGDGRLGEEMAARFTESSEVAEEVTCLVGDESEGVVWSGYKDGKIRCWRMECGKRDGGGGGGGGGGGDGFKECLSWQAHRGAVLSMVVTSYGELWFCVM